MFALPRFPNQEADFSLEYPDGWLVPTNPAEHRPPLNGVKIDPAVASVQEGLTGRQILERAYGLQSTSSHTDAALDPGDLVLYAVYHAGQGDGSTSVYLISSAEWRAMFARMTDADWFMVTGEVIAFVDGTEDEPVLRYATGDPVGWDALMAQYEA